MTGPIGVQLPLWPSLCRYARRVAGRTLRALCSFDSPRTLIKAFRMHGLATKYRAELVTYADDFVVLCGGDARKVLDIVRQWMTRIGLTINEAKTSVRDARHEHFDFLGYTFGPLHSPRTGGKYNGARPSNKAVARLREAVRARLRPGNQAVIADVVKALNRVLRGWANYFCYGSRTKACHAMDLHVEERVRAFLRRRHKVAGRGYRQFPKEKIFDWPIEWCL